VIGTRKGNLLIQSNSGATSESLSSGPVPGQGEQGSVDAARSMRANARAWSAPALSAPRAQAGLPRERRFPPLARHAQRHPGQPVPRFACPQPGAVRRAGLQFACRCSRTMRRMATFARLLVAHLLMGRGFGGSRTSWGWRGREEKINGDAEGLGGNGAGLGGGKERDKTTKMLKH
jgi:hypothetical protein